VLRSTIISGQYTITLDMQCVVFNLAQAVKKMRGWSIVRCSAPLAQRAMTTETRGQNSWFNFSRANEGKAPKDRAFAEQKVGILQDEFLPETARRDRDKS